MAAGAAVVGLFVLAGCGSGNSATPEAAPSSSPPASTTETGAPSSTPPLGVPSSPTSEGPINPGPVAGVGPGAGAPPTTGTSGSGVGAGSGALAPRPSTAAAPAVGQDARTVAYTGRFCTALAPLAAFKQQNENPNLAGVTDGRGAKDLAIRLLTQGIATAQGSVNAVTELGPAPDPQAAAGVNDLLGSLRQAIAVGQGLLPQAQAVDPNDSMALFALANQAKAQAGTSATVGLTALRTSTGPAMGAALHTLPQCAPLGI